MASTAVSDHEKLEDWKKLLENELCINLNLQVRLTKNLFRLHYRGQNSKEALHSNDDNGKVRC